MKILVLSSYTKRQKHTPDNLLREADYCSYKRLARRKKDLSGYNAEGWYHEDRDYSARAGEMFKGPQAKLIREGLKQVRGHADYGKTRVDWYFPWNHPRVIDSERLTSEHDVIVPFNIPSRPTLLGEHKIPEFLTALISRYNLVLSLLRQEDIWIFEHAFERQHAATLIFLIARRHRYLIADDLLNVHVIETGKALRDSLKTSNWALKALIFKELCAAACREGFHVFEQVTQHPERLVEIVLGTHLEAAASSL